MKIVARILMAMLWLGATSFSGWTQESQDKKEGPYGFYKGVVLDVYASTQENADLLGAYIDEYATKEFERIFGPVSARGAAVFIGEDFQLQKFSAEENAMWKKGGAIWAYRGPEKLMVAMVKDKENLPKMGPGQHFQAGTFMHYFGVTMLSYHIYFKPPKEKRKEERLRLEEMWGNKYLMPFWFATFWTLYSEPPHIKTDRWNSLAKRFAAGHKISFQKYFTGGYNFDFNLLYSYGLPIFEYMLEVGGPEFIRHLLDCFMAGKGAAEGLKWLEDNKEKLKLENPPATIERFEEDWYAWARKKLEERKAQKQ